MKRFSIIAGILTLVLLVGILVGTSDVVLAKGHRGHDGKGFWANLTDEQREAVQEKREEMRSQGATREEIHSAVAEMLKGYGIEVPEACHGPLGLAHGKAGLKDNLTQEQREVIRNKTRELRDQGASREEIHSAVAEMLKGYGIEVPEESMGPPPPGCFGPGPGGFWKDLTDEQREAVQEKIKEMRDQGASREEIHSAVAEMLKGYGVELPEKCRLLGGPRGLRHDRDGFMANLTDEQREAVQQKIKEMRDQGASRKEIHSAVAEMLKGYGIELPEWGKGDGFHPFGPGPGGFWGDLTEEQREAIHEKIKEMRDQGASREEIRAAVAELLEGFGIESPESSESTSSQTASAKLQIQAQSYPNPFNPQAEIAYSLPEDSHVKLTIYNIQGQKVTTLVDEYQSAGIKKVVWDGHDEKGESVASGVYLYRIEAGPYNVTNRMVLLK